MRTVALKDEVKVARVPGVAMVYTNTYTGIPAAFTNLLANVPALHEVVVFITVRYPPLCLPAYPKNNPYLLFGE